MELNTFSIAAHDPAENSYGIAVATARPVVGTLVPFVDQRAAIATQARVNTDLGRNGLKLIESGLPLELACVTLLANDEDRKRRQLHGVSGSDAYAFTGEECVDWAGHRMGEGFTIAGNMLVGPKVLEAMERAFLAAADLDLSARLLSALEAGQLAGGDRRGKESAALRVFSPTPQMVHNLRVDQHSDPVNELRRIYDLVAEQAKQIESEYGAEGLRLFSKIRV